MWGNGFWTPETEGPELPLKRSFFPAETASRPRAPAKPRGIRQTTGNLGYRGTAWWAREDSNLQPAGYGQHVAISGRHFRIRRAQTKQEDDPLRVASIDRPLAGHQRIA